MNSRRKCLRFCVKYVFVSWIFFLSSCNTFQDKGGENYMPLPDAIEKGKRLFSERCSTCHRINQEVTGPALKGVETRWPDKQKLYAFIRNSEEVIRSDPYARKLWLKYNQTIMLTQPDLTDTDIRAVLDYINNAPEK